MKSFITGLLLSTAVFAHDLSLTCTGSVNTSQIFTQNLVLKAGARNVSVGTFDRFEMILSSLGEHMVELQLLNNEEPSRTYATATLSKANPSVALSIWKEQFMVDAKCALTVTDR